MTDNKNGSFIVFEGLDGCGKSTQIELLAERFAEQGIACELTHEQTNGRYGQLISDILSHRVRADERLTAALFLADRIDHLTNEENGICKLICEGVNVISDRYYYSSFAYQGVSLPMDWIMSLNKPCREILTPTMCIFIDIAPERAFERLTAGRETLELYEKLEYLSKVRGKYFEAFEKLRDTERVYIVDGDRPEEEIHAEIWEIVKKNVAV